MTFNFHIHTRYSADGFNSFSEIYRHARHNKIDVLAITDHDTTEGAVDFLIWLQSKKKNDLQLITGNFFTGN